MKTIPFKPAAEQWVKEPGRDGAFQAVPLLRLRGAYNTVHPSRPR
jgi:hypothetical protein